MNKFGKGEKGFFTRADRDFTDVPKNVSAFNNDVGYITQQDISGKTDSRQESENNIALWDGEGQFKTGVSLLRILQDIVDNNTADIQDIIAQISPVPVTGWQMVRTAKQDYSGEYILGAIVGIIEIEGGNNSFGYAFKSPLANYLGNTTQIQTQNYVITLGAQEASRITVTKKGMVDSGTYSGKNAYSISYINANNERKYWTYSAQGLSNISSDTGNNAQWIFYQNDKGKLEVINRGTTNYRLYFDLDKQGFVQKQFVSGDPTGCYRPSLFELISL